MSQEFYDLPDEAATLSLGADLARRLAAGTTHRSSPCPPVSLPAAAASPAAT